MYTDSEDNDDDEGNFETDDSDEEIPAAYPGYSSTSAFDRGYGGAELSQRLVLRRSACSTDCTGHDLPVRLRFGAHDRC